MWLTQKGKNCRNLNNYGMLNILGEYCNLFQVKMTSSVQRTNPVYCKLTKCPKQITMILKNLFSSVKQLVGAYEVFQIWVKLFCHPILLLTGLHWMMKAGLKEK